MLGITFLAGLLLFQGSNAAMASGDIGVAQQPMAFLGDLGDISTGFASVRITCLFHLLALLVHSNLTKREGFLNNQNSSKIPLNIQK